MVNIEWKNRLYYGDNLLWLRDHDHFPNESIDLIYLDPPFNSNADYNVIFREHDGKESQAQVETFEDTWRWEREASEQALNELGNRAPEVANFISWLGGQRDKTSKSMAAYLAMMAVRLVELHRITKPTGSLYLHCDPTAGHYLKVVLDRIFGSTNLRNEIVWKRTTAHSDPKRFGRIHDTLLFYSKSEKPTWHTVFMPYDPEYIKTYYRYTDASGRKFLSRDLTAPSHGSSSGQYEWRGKLPPKGRMWAYTKDNMEQLEAEGRIFYTNKGYPRLKQYLEDMPGMPAQSIWTDVLNIRSWHKEDLGYDTQKPLALLERIIRASSKEGDIVLDPFCGCGTTIIAANNPELRRRWIGIDVTWIAIDLVERRLRDSYGEQVRNSYVVYGKPYDLASAQALADKSKKEFELWALSLVGAAPREQDGGVDGLLAFVEKQRKIRKVIVQVKGGEALSPSMVRDLIGTVEKEGAAIGLLVTLKSPTSGMVELAVHAGLYESALWDKFYPRIQIRTINELLIEGKQFDLPPQISHFKRAASIGEQGRIETML